MLLYEKKFLFFHDIYKTISLAITVIYVRVSSLLFLGYRFSCAKNRAWNWEVSENPKTNLAAFWLAYYKEISLVTEYRVLIINSNNYPTLSNTPQ